MSNGIGVTLTIEMDKQGCVFHLPVVIGIALLPDGSGLPIMAKFLMLFASALAVTVALSEFVLPRIPDLKRIL